MASEYGWSKLDILENVYLDELLYLSKEANKRHIREWKMQLAITQNPYSKKPRELWDIISAQDKDHVDEKLDKSGLNILRQKLTSNPRFIFKGGGENEKKS